jgi:hypothetical protein
MKIILKLCVSAIVAIIIFSIWEFYVFRIYTTRWWDGKGMIDESGKIYDIGFRIDGCVVWREHK